MTVAVVPCPLARAPLRWAPRVADDLRRLRLFRHFDDGDLERVFAHLKVRELFSGDVLNEDDLHRSVFFVWSGAYRLAFLSPSGVHVTIRSLGCGDLLGEGSALGIEEQRHCCLLGDEDGVLLEMPAAQFAGLLQEMPALCFATVKALAVIAADRAARIYEFATFDVKRRVQAELLRLACQGRSSGDHIVIDPAPTHDTIATQVGTTREGVTRQLKALAQRGLVAVRRGQITILDLPRLRASLETCVPALGANP